LTRTGSGGGNSTAAKIMELAETLGVVTLNPTN